MPDVGRWPNLVHPFEGQQKALQKLPREDSGGVTVEEWAAALAPHALLHLDLGDES